MLSKAVAHGLGASGRALGLLASVEPGSAAPSREELAGSAAKFKPNLRLYLGAAEPNPGSSRASVVGDLSSGEREASGSLPVREDAHGRVHTKR